MWDCNNTVCTVFWFLVANFTSGQGLQMKNSPAGNSGIITVLLVNINSHWGIKWENVVIFKNNYCSWSCNCVTHINNFIITYNKIQWTLTKAGPALDYFCPLRYSKQKQRSISPWLAVTLPGWRFHPLQGSECLWGVSVQQRIQDIKEL